MATNLSAKARIGLRAVLLGSGCVMVLAFPFVPFPIEWMSAVHRWLGMGDLPSEPIVGYLARNLSAFYGFLGVLMFLIAMDPKRYWPMITLMGLAGLVFGPCMFAIDFVEGMPFFWTLGEGLFVTLTGVVILALQRLATPAVFSHDA